MADQITAGWAMQPFIAEKVTNEGAQVLVNSRDELGALPADLVAVNTDYADANPDNLTAFFTVVKRLNEWVVGNPDEAAAEIGPLVGVTPEVMKAAYAATPGYREGLLADRRCRRSDESVRIDGQGGADRRADRLVDDARSAVSARRRASHLLTSTVPG